MGNSPSKDKESKKDSKAPANKSKTLVTSKQPTTTTDPKLATPTPVNLPPQIIQSKNETSKPKNDNQPEFIKLDVENETEAKKEPIPVKEIQASNEVGKGELAKGQEEETTKGETQAETGKEVFIELDNEETNSNGNRVADMGQDLLEEFDREESKKEEMVEVMLKEFDEVQTKKEEKDVEHQCESANRIDCLTPEIVACTWPAPESEVETSECCAVTEVRYAEQQIPIVHTPILVPILETKEEPKGEGHLVEKQLNSEPVPVEEHKETESSQVDVNTLIPSNEIPTVTKSEESTSNLMDQLNEIADGNIIEEPKHDAKTEQIVVGLSTKVADDPHRPGPLIDDSEPQEKEVSSGFTQIPDVVETLVETPVNNGLSVPLEEKGKAVIENVEMEGVVLCEFKHEISGWGNTHRIETMCGVDERSWGPINTTPEDKKVLNEQERDDIINSVNAKLLDIKESTDEPESEPIASKKVTPQDTDCIAEKVEATPIEATPVEEKPIEAKPVEATPIESKPVEEKPVDCEQPCKSNQKIEVTPADLQVCQHDHSHEKKPDVDIELKHVVSGVNPETIPVKLDMICGEDKKTWGPDNVTPEDKLILGTPKEESTKLDDKENHLQVNKGHTALPESTENDKSTNHEDSKKEVPSE